MKVTVIIPVYSEEEVLRDTVSRVITAVGGTLENVVMVVSPRSSQRTFLICEELTRTYPQVSYFRQEKNPGLGFALREAFPRVTGTHALIVDGDGEFDLASIPAMMARAADADVVVASRWMRGGKVFDYDPLTYILNRSFQYIFRLLFWTRIHDLTYGYKLVSKEVLDRFAWQGQWHEIAMETTLRPLKAGYRVAEVPSVWRKRREGVSKITLWKRFRYVPFAFRIFFGSSA